MGVAHHPALLGLVQLSDFEPLRVASHTDMTTAVHFSLERLASMPERPLVLHTLPPPPPSSPTLSSAPDPSPSAAQISQKQVETAVDAIPKLVSILEIIKRELPSCSDAGNGAKPSSPLHQYTRLTTFESALDYQRPAPAEVQAETQDLEAVRQELVQLEWLSGRAGKAKRPRKRHSPCMVVVLSREPLPALAKSPCYTYQKPSPVSKKRPRPTARPTAAEALPLTSTPIPGQGTRSRSQPPLPEPSQPDATSGRAQGGRSSKAKADGAVVASGNEGSRGTEEEQRKKKKNRRKIRRRVVGEETEDRTAPAAGGVSENAETGEARMDISA